jgi:subtilisin family serine protease
VKRRPNFRFAWPFIALLSIPFIYNSCQGGLLGAKGFSSKSSQLKCKVGLEKGVVTKLELPGDRQPSAFETQKVRLREDLNSNSPQAKASGPVQVDAGSRLSVILNNRCLQEKQSELVNYPITSKAISKSLMIPDLDRQAYEWVLDEPSTDDAIESQAGSEPCVVGISWNKEYSIQALALNDTGLLYQTHLGAIKAQEAYDLFYNGTGGMNMTGPSVNVAVIDTGVDWQHPDIQNNMWAHTNGMGIDITTLNTTLVDYNPFDVSSIGHGTHVAGIIAAVSNNNRGVAGTMPYRGKIMAIKIFRVGTNNALSTTSEYFYNGVKFAYLNGAHVINLSLGSISSGAATDSVAASAVEEAVQNGAVVTTVIGNADGGANGRLIDGTNYSSIPGQYATRPGVIGVGSFDSVNGEKSYFSHYSPVFVEISAPGAEQGSTGIYSTLPRALSSYGRLAGTSQAGPIVSAAAGLTIGIIREAYGVSPTPTEVERLLTESAVKSPNLNTYFKDGNKLDLKSLIAKINADYPLTRTGGSVDLSSNGCAK